MLFLFGWPPCQRSDMTLMEVSQHALDSLYIRSIWLLYIVMFFVNLIWYLYLFWLNKHCLSKKKHKKKPKQNKTSRWGRYSWGPLLIGGGVVGWCCRVAEWPASVGWRFSDIGNWFPDIGKSSTFPDIGKSIPDIENHFPISGNRSFPDIGNWFPDIGNSNSRYRKIIPDIGKCWIKTQMAFHTCKPDWLVYTDSMWYELTNQLCALTSKIPTDADCVTSEMSMHDIHKDKNSGIQC